MMTNEIQNYTEQLLKTLGFSIDSIEISISDSGSRLVNVSSPDSREIIGKDGETLDAINHILKRFIEKNTEEKNHIILDVNGYQEKKIQKIKTIAHMMSERARFFKSNVELEPMNSFERHIIHEYISPHNDLETESVGFGKSRKVIIKYKQNNP